MSLNKEELESKLLTMLDSVVNSVGEGMDFMASQLPEYISQLLLWFAISNFVEMCVGILLMYVVYKLCAFSKSTLTSKDSSEDAQVVACLAIVLSVVLFILSVCSINIEWLKILIAPKVWLVEYILQLKGG